MLHRFGKGTDGRFGAAGLTDVNGTLYSTTIGGGRYSQGTVFSITTGGKEKVLIASAVGPTEQNQRTRA